MYRISTLKMDNYWIGNFSIDFLCFSDREQFNGLAESSTAEQNNIHDEPSFNFNSLGILTWDEVKDVTSLIFARVSHSSFFKKSSLSLESQLL